MRLNKGKALRMLGDLIFEGEGTLSGMKRLPDGRMTDELKIEVTALGLEFSDIVTIELKHRKDGTVFASVGGEFTTESGENVHRSGIANGMRMPDGSYVLRGVACLSCPPGRFARLNGIAIIWEANVTNGGTYQFKGWEWK